MIFKENMQFDADTCFRRMTQANSFDIRNCAWAFLLSLLLYPFAVQADVVAEVSISDRSFSARPAGYHMTLYDFGDAGECARAAKVIGSVVLRLNPPWDPKMTEAKVSEIEPTLLKSGADGLIVTNFIINDYTPKGFISSASMVCSVIRFVDEPRVDLRSEEDFARMLGSNAKAAPIEGIWVDQVSKERVAFFEDPKQPGRYLGVQFDNAGLPFVPKGLVVADLRLQPDGWLVGHFIFDDFVRFPTRLKMPSGDEFKFLIKKQNNACLSRAYPDMFPPEYQLHPVAYVRQAGK